MNTDDSSRKIRQLLAEASGTQPEDWFLCLKARFGMQVVFKSIADTEGAGDVIASPFTCITSINPALTAGFTPIFTDIAPETLSIKRPAEKLAKKTTKAIIMQHTLGIIGDKNELLDYAKKHKLFVVEDSAHCLTRMHLNKKGEVAADFSVHSFGVEKILVHTKFGGAIYVNPRLQKSHPDLYQKTISFLLSLEPAPKSYQFRTRFYRPGNAFIHLFPESFKDPLTAAAIATGLFEPSIRTFEQRGKQYPPFATNSWVNEKILAELPTLPLNYKRRLRNTAHYRKLLKSKKFTKLTKVDEPLLAFPVLFDATAQANAAYALLTSHGFHIRRWYLPLLYPGPKDLRQYNYDPKTCPISENYSTRVLSLPTNIPEKSCKELIALLKDPS